MLVQRTAEDFPLIKVTNETTFSDIKTYINDVANFLISKLGLVKRNDLTVDTDIARPSYIETTNDAYVIFLTEPSQANPNINYPVLCIHNHYLYSGSQSINVYKYCFISVVKYAGNGFQSCYASSSGQPNFSGVTKEVYSSLQIQLDADDIKCKGILNIFDDGRKYLGLADYNRNSGNFYQDRPQGGIFYTPVCPPNTTLQAYFLIGKCPGASYNETLDGFIGGEEPSRSELTNLRNGTWITASGFYPGKGKGKDYLLKFDFYIGNAYIPNVCWFSDATNKCTVGKTVVINNERYMCIDTERDTSGNYCVLVIPEELGLPNIPEETS